MKTWFFLSFLALLLIQGSAGASTITTTTLSTSLVYVSCPTCPSTSKGTFTYTFDTDSDPKTTQRSFSYRITLSPDEILKYYFSPPSYTTQLPTNDDKLSPQPPITLPSVVDIFIGNQNQHSILEIAQLKLARDASGTFVSEFITRDPNIFINLNNNSLSGTMTYDECSRTGSDGPGKCNFLSNPAPLLTCQDYLWVYNDDRMPTGLDLRGQICTAPAPSSLSLVGIGLAGLGLLRQCRKPHLPALQPA